MALSAIRVVCRVHISGAYEHASAGQWVCRATGLQEMGLQGSGVAGQWDCRARE